MKNIVLTGYMASGKTTVGKIMAKILNMDFCDTDKLIEDKKNMSVSKIFEVFGEKKFREFENELSKELADRNNCIIATGGGFVLNPENIENLRKNAVIVNLKTNPEIIKNRLEEAKDKRPLMKNSDFDGIIKRFYDREKFYENCDVCIDLKIDKSPQWHANYVIEKLRNNKSI